MNIQSAHQMYEEGFPKHYKHKTIMRFAVGPYQFENHVLTVDDSESNNDFLREVEGLLMVDQVNIVEVLNIENEKPVDSRSRVTRGSSASNNAGLSDQTAEARASELNRREQELLNRELALEARERVTYSKTQGDVDPAPEAQTDPAAPTADSGLNPNSETAPAFAEANFQAPPPADEVIPNAEAEPIVDPADKGAAALGRDESTPAVTQRTDDANSPAPTPAPLKLGGLKLAGTN